MIYGRKTRADQNFGELGLSHLQFICDFAAGAVQKLV
jgi:hypothetical protein